MKAKFNVVEIVSRNGPGRMDISGGTFKGAIKGYNGNVTVNVSGGTFLEPFSNTMSAEGSKTQISGGKFLLRLHLSEKFSESGENEIDVVFRDEVLLQ